MTPRRRTYIRAIAASKLRTRRHVAGCVMLAVTLMSFAGCSSGGSGSEPESGSYGQRYFVLGDEFRRVAAWCDGPNMVYEAEYRSPALAVVVRMAGFSATMTLAKP